MNIFALWFYFSKCGFLDYFYYFCTIIPHYIILFYMPIFTILFYFGSGMFISLVLLLGLSLLYRCPGAIIESHNGTALRRIGFALLMLTVPALLELIRDFLPAGTIFSAYLIPAVDVLVAALFLWTNYSFFKQYGYAVLPFAAISLSASLTLLPLAISMLSLFVGLVGAWLTVMLVISAIRVVRCRASIKMCRLRGDHRRLAGLILLFVLNFALNPFFLYASVAARAINIFYVFFSLMWMSMGIVLLNTLLSSLAHMSAEVGEPTLTDNTATTPDEVPLTDDPDRRTADDYFTADQQQKMKAQLEKMMAKDKLYRSADLCVSDLVKRFDTNASYFYYFMRDVMHTSFFDYVNGYRVEEAKELLIKGDKVDYIIMRVGFNSDTTFRRAFKRVTGQTPTEWRLQHVKD